MQALVSHEQGLLRLCTGSQGQVHPAVSRGVRCEMSQANPFCASRCPSHSRCSSAPWPACCLTQTQLRIALANAPGRVSERDMADASAAAAEAKPAVFVPPPKIEELFAQASGQMATVNRPVAGAKREEELPEGSAPIQLYSAGTPNGAKVAILLEELADAVGLEYDAFRINISQGAQFTSGFVKVNPNSKIPAIVDKQGPDGKPISIWESANIDLYLAEKYDKFIPKDPRAKNEMMTWIFWQMSAQGPISGACFGHFFVYAPDDKVAAREYGLARYGMEVQRLCSVLDQHLEGKTYMVGEEYTLADIMCFPWYNILKVFWKHPGTGLTANDFLSLDQYKNVNAWWERIAARPAVKRGLTVCSFQFPVAKPWLEPPKTEAS